MAGWNGPSVRKPRSTVDEKGHRLQPYTQSRSRKFSRVEVRIFVENSILTNAHFEIIPGMAALARCDWETGKWLS